MNKNKVKWLVLTIAVTTIITVTFIRLDQININHQANLTKSEECIENFGTVVAEENVFLSLTSVYCIE
ncbi:hypothetical protein QMK38_04130 [Lysinibacillus fusiformis]|nr:hypothetical protein [Lysinibacillus fusiformis]